MPCNFENEEPDAEKDLNFNLLARWIPFLAPNVNLDDSAPYLQHFDECVAQQPYIELSNAVHLPRLPEIEEQKAHVARQSDIDHQPSEEKPDLLLARGFVVNDIQLAPVTYDRSPFLLPPAFLYSHREALGQASIPHLELRLCESLAARRDIRTASILG